MTVDRRDDAHELEQGERSAPASIPPPPTEPTLQGLAAGIDAARKDARVAMRHALQSALMSEQAAKLVAAATAQPPIVVHMPAPPASAPYMAAATVLAGIGTFVGGMSVAVLVAWALASNHPPALPAAPAPEPTAWYRSPNVTSR